MCCKNFTKLKAYKAQLVNWYNVSPIAMGQTPPKGLVMVKRQATPKTCAIWGGMQPCAIWKQSWNNLMNPLAKSSGWKQSRRCSKTILERPPIDKCNMSWNVNLKELEESLKSLFGL